MLVDHPSSLGASAIWLGPQIPKVLLQKHSRVRLQGRSERPPLLFCGPQSIKRCSLTPRLYVYSLVLKTWGCMCLPIATVRKHCHRSTDSPTSIEVDGALPPLRVSSDIDSDAWLVFIALSIASAFRIVNPTK